MRNGLARGCSCGPALIRSVRTRAFRTLCAVSASLSFESPPLGLAVCACTFVHKRRQPAQAARFTFGISYDILERRISNQATNLKKLVGWRTITGLGIYSEWWQAFGWDQLHFDFPPRTTALGVTGFVSQNILIPQLHTNLRCDIRQII
jgi:hypothetical protein